LSKKKKRLIFHKSAEIVSLTFCYVFDFYAVVFFISITIMVNMYLVIVDICWRNHPSVYFCC